MKSNAKLNVIISITIGIVLAFSITITTNLNFTTGTSDRSTEYSDEINSNNENLKLSKVSGKIHIDGNSGWADFKNAGNCTGQGTYSDPYTIEDLVIDGGGSGSCILIENSSVYFKIENCTLYNSGGGYTDAGIRLVYINNSQLINNNCSFNNGKGIFLVYGKGNNISGNIANNNSKSGIRLTVSHNNNISGNTANNNNLPDGYYGIFVYKCNNSIFLRNTANNNGHGIYFDKGYNNTVSDGEFHHNKHDGIRLDGYSINNTISLNNATENGAGIVVSWSSDSIITENILTNNSIGIWAYGNSSINNFFFKNYAFNNYQTGIFFNRASNNKITGNLISNNGDWGLRLVWESNNNIITENIFNNNGWVPMLWGCYGISFELNSNDNVVYQNNFNGNRLHALDDGINNHWDNGSIGNYWDNYTGVDADGDGIGDTPYVIPGTAGSQDNFPIWKDGSKPIIPGYNLLILLGTLSIVSIIISKRTKKS